METPEGPPRFECPADFCPCPFSPGPGFSQETLRSPSKQLWLIRAPANFRPESLDGHAVPLLGSQMLKASQPDGTRKVYSFQAVPADLDSAHLLIPSNHQDRLTCAPPFSGLLSVCERFGDPGANQPLFPVEARLAPQIPAGLKQRFLPFGGHPQVREVAEEPPRKKKKKKRGLHTLGYLGAPEEPLSPQHKPHSTVPAEVFVAPAEAGGLQEERRSRKHRHREVPPAPAVGTAPQLLPEQGLQPSSSLEGSSQESLSGGVTDTSHGSRKKRKKEKPQKEEAEGWLPEPSSLPQQSGLEKTWAAEGLLPSKMKKKKRRQQEEEEAAVASVDIVSAEQEAEGGQGDFRGPEPILEGSLGESLPTSKHKKKKKKDKVVVEEPEAGALLLEPSPVQIDLVDWAEQGPEQLVSGLPGEEGTSQKHKKKKKKHKKEAAEEESWPA